MPIALSSVGDRPCLWRQGHDRTIDSAPCFVAFLSYAPTGASIPRLSPAPTIGLSYAGDGRRAGAANIGRIARSILQSNERLLVILGQHPSQTRISARRSWSYAHEQGAAKCGQHR
jgi:hypothetical protein